MKLGRRRPQPHQRRKRARLGPSMLPTPLSRFDPAPVAWQLFANDKYGDCTVAALAHLLLQHATIEGRELVLDEQQVVNLYLYLSSGQDNGLVETDVLAYAQEHGYPLDGREKLASVVAIDPANVLALQSLCGAFRGLYVGAELPTRAQWQLGGRWDLPAAFSDDDVPGSWGGHAMFMAGFDERGPIFVTWGALQHASWEWVRRYCDEAYVVLGYSRACSGNIDGLALDLAAAVQEDGV